MKPPIRRRGLARAFARIAIATMLCGNVATSVRAADAVPTIAVFDFELVNTSLQPTTQTETERLARLGEALRGALDDSGRYRVIGTPAVREAAAHLRSLRDCGGCELPVARTVGADLVAYGWVQKVSNLILNINIVVENADTGRHVAVGSVDIRGNTDDSWSHGLRFLLRERVLPQ